MNEEETKAILRESLVKPSDDFTDKLMEKIEQEPYTKKTFSWLFFFACFFGVIVFISLFFLFNYFSFHVSFLKFSFNLHPLFLQLPLFLILAFQFVKLFDDRRESLSKLNSV